MSRAHQALMGVNANPRANAKMVAHVIQSMANAIVLVDGRYKSLVAATDERNDPTEFLLQTLLDI